MFRYIQSEPTLWTVGSGFGKDWSPVSDHDSEDKARAECAYLNGGPRPPAGDQEELRLDPWVTIRCKRYLFNGKALARVLLNDDDLEHSILLFDIDYDRRHEFLAELKSLIQKFEE